jgi:hypothetical protein
MSSKLEDVKSGPLHSNALRSIAALWILCPLLLAAETPGVQYAHAIHEAGLDPQECYRVRDIAFARDDVHIYFTDGYLIFGKPVNGRRLSAVFSAEDEPFDGEVLVLPPHRSERRSLATFAHTPNLEEHIRAGVFLFTDNTPDELLALLRQNASKKVPEAGMLLADKWRDVVRNISDSFEVRLVEDEFSGRQGLNGALFAAFAGKQVGNFDIVYDPRAREQITIGQVTSRDNRMFFDIWSSFMARPWRSQNRQIPADNVTLSDYRIDATLQPDLHLKVVTRMKATVNGSPGRAVAFELSRRMKVTAVRVDGHPAELFAHDSLRANLNRGDNDVFLVITASPLEKGKTYELEFEHEGDVIAPAGKGVYFVGSRGNWYPNRGAVFAAYDLTFHYPKELSLVSTGEVVDDRVDGDSRITHRRASSPIRFAGFNLGNYEQTSISRGGYTVEVYANRTVESALQPRPKEIEVPPLPQLSRQNRRPEMAPLNIEKPPPDPKARLRELATEVTAALEFMSSYFGPPPLKTLTVSPIPGGFGQGFPGLLYLSTMSYLDPKDRPAAVRNSRHETFYSELLQAHETAHQWWGNLVTSAGYQDDWLMESLANYSAMLYVEKRRGRKTVDTLLDQYKDHLLTKTDDGRSLESMGPIVWGTRLYSSQAPEAWKSITYEKGSWIMHMLRARMGDENFLRMLGQVVARYRYKRLSTEQFRALAAEFLPPKSPDPKLENFFEQWIYGTGIPTLRMTQSTTGKAPAVKVKGTISQSDVDEDFSALVPVEAQLPGKHSVTCWVQTSAEPVPFTMDLKQPPLKIVLDPSNSILAIRK